MVLPEYRISLGLKEPVNQLAFDDIYRFGTIDYDLIETTGAIASYIDLGKTTGVEKVGLLFFTWSEVEKIMAILPYIVKGGSPTDLVKMELFHCTDGNDIDGTLTLLATSVNQYNDFASRRIYHFDRVLMEKVSGDHYYFWAVSRTGTKSDTNYWRHPERTYDGMAWGITVTYESGSWTKQPGTDPELIFKSAYDDGNYDYFGAWIKYVGSQAFIRVNSFTFYGAPYGPDIRPLRCAVLNKDTNSLIALSVSQKTEAGKLTFYFPDSTLTKNVNYAFIMYSDCIDDPWTAASTDSYWEAEFLTGTVGAPTRGNFGPDDEIYAALISGSYNLYDEEVNGWGSSYSVPRFEIEYIREANALEITEDVLRATINSGKNNVDGAMIEGSCDLSLRDNDGNYNPYNAAGAYYGDFKIFSWVNIYAFWESAGGPMYTGPIKKITPTMKLGLQPTNVWVGDLFYRLKNNKISVGALSGKTASELIEIVLLAMGLGEANWDIDTSDTTVLANITWDNVTAISCLNTIIECGQHHHFIDVNGKYIFRSNQWLASGAEKYSFDKNNSKAPKVEFDIEAVKNKIIVIYNETEYEANDYESQELHDVRELTIDNELMPSADYALFIARFVLEDFSYPGKRLEFTMQNLYPEMLDLNPGDVVNFSNTSLNIDARYIVLGLTRNFDTRGDHTLTMKCREWFQPPTNILSIHSPVVGDSWRKLNSGATKGSTSFQIPTNFVPSSVDLTLKHSLNNDTIIYAYIYEANGDRLPTGSPIITSAPVTILYADTDDTYTFYFPTASQIKLDPNTDYCIVFDAPKTNEFFTPFSLPSTSISFQEDDVDFKAFGQSFEISEAEDLNGIVIYLGWNALETLSFGTYVEIFAADGSGHPTGAALATSKTIYFSGVCEAKRVYEFETPPSLAAATPYCWRLNEAHPSDAIVWDTSHLRAVSRLAGGTVGPLHYSRCGQVFSNTRDVLNPTIQLQGDWLGPDTPIQLSIYNTAAGIPTTVLDSGSEVILKSAWPLYEAKFTRTLTGGTAYGFIMGIFSAIAGQLFYARGISSNAITSGNMFIEAGGAGQWVDQGSGYDMAFKMIGEKYKNEWTVRGLNTNPYANGLAWKQKSSDSSYVDITSTDFWFALRTDAECRWEMWGQATDPRVMEHVLVSQFISDWENELCPGALDDCDTADWTEDGMADGEELNSLDKVQGDYALNLGKDNHGAPPSYVQFGYTKNITSADADDTWAGMWLKIKTAAAAILRDSPTLPTLRIVFRTSSGNLYQRQWIFDDLGDSDDWNPYGDTFPDNWTQVGSPDPSDITALQIIMWTTNVADTITLGDLIMDYWLFYDDYHACGIEFELKYY